MTIDLNEIAIFIKVIESGSFSKAAQVLNMPNSTVSAKISQLEKRLGVTLIRRTTRKLFVTHEGQIFFDRCKMGLAEIHLAEEQVASGLNLPQGTLKITAPIELGSAILPEVIEKYRDTYPEILFDVHLSDRIVDIIGEGFDLAIRIGALKDSSLKSKKIGDIYFAPFASPAYLKKYGAPKNPRELEKHYCLQFTPLGLDQWKFVGPKTVHVNLKKDIIINELNMIKSLTVTGMGVSLLPTFLCLQEVSAQKLVRLMPDWKANQQPISFVYSGDRYISPKVRTFISLSQDLMKEKIESFDF